MIDVVGLDLSLTSTGIALRDDLTLAISTNTKGPERLRFMWETIEDIMTIYDILNPYVVLEGYAFAKRGTHAFSMGELGGVVKYELFKANIPFVEVAPTMRAKFATGRGNANKAEVVSTISARTGIVFAGPGADDRVDAWILLEMGKQHFGLSERDWPATQLKVLEKVKWI